MERQPRKNSFRHGWEYLEAGKNKQITGGSYENHSLFTAGDFLIYIIHRHHTEVGDIHVPSDPALPGNAGWYRATCIPDEKEIYKTQAGGNDFQCLYGLLFFLVHDHDFLLDFHTTIHHQGHLL